MADRFYKDIEIPDLPLGVNLPNPEDGFIQLVGRQGKLSVKTSNGVEQVIEPTVVTELLIDGGNANTDIQNAILVFDFGSAQ